MRVCRALANIQSEKRMIFGKNVLVRFHKSRRRDGTCNERNAHRLKRFRREGLRRQSGPKAVTIARDGGEAGDVIVANEIVDFAFFYIRSAGIGAGKASVSRAGPGRG